jgi:hypothetical protein
MTMGSCPRGGEFAESTVDDYRRVAGRAPFCIDPLQMRTASSGEGLRRGCWHAANTGVRRLRR